jgi:type II secretory pathway pseudopilin PulG
MMIVVSLVGLLAGIAIPSMIHARSQTQKNLCINNLRLIDGAKQQWAFEQNESSANTPVQADLQPYVNRNGSGIMPVCPSGSLGSTFAQTYAIEIVGEMPECLIVPSSHFMTP